MNEQQKKLIEEIKPVNIFVTSMGDLFGDWVPDDWIKTVFDACNAAPQHRYLFLTKNPRRYTSFHLSRVIHEPNYWFETTVTKDVGIDGQGHFTPFNINTFTSIEPLVSPIDFTVCGDKHFKWMSKWVIIGAMTGPGSAKHQPRREWVENIVNHCRAAGVPVFLKNNLAKVWDEPLIQEFPWDKEDTQCNATNT